MVLLSSPLGRDVGSEREPTECCSGLWRWQMAWIGNFATGRPFSMTPTSTTLLRQRRSESGGEFDTKSGHVVVGRRSIYRKLLVG